MTLVASTASPLTIVNAGAHPAHYPTIKLAVVRGDPPLLHSVQLQTPAIDILGGRDAKATFGQLSEVEIGDSYFAIKLSYADPILSNQMYVSDQCLAYEPLATDPSRPATATCSQDLAGRVLAAALGEALPVAT